MDALAPLGVLRESQDPTCSFTSCMNANKNRRARSGEGGGGRRALLSDTLTAGEDAVGAFQRADPVEQDDDGGVVLGNSGNSGPQSSEHEVVLQPTFVSSPSRRGGGGEHGHSLSFDRGGGCGSSSFSRCVYRLVPVFCLFLKGSQPEVVGNLILTQRFLYMYMFIYVMNICVILL